MIMTTLNEKHIVKWVGFCMCRLEARILAEEMKLTFLDFRVSIVSLLMCSH
jgi:hypothetical protein